MKAKDLLSTGFAIAVFDEDVSSNDTIAAKGTIVVTEAELLQGFVDISNQSTLTTLRAQFQRQ